MPKSQPIKIDILDMEMSKGLPHWLDPIEKYKGRYDADRKQRRIARANEIQAEQKKSRKKKQWQRTKARSLRLLAKYDPAQPRDEGGKWTDGSGAEPSAVPGYKPGVKGRGEEEVALHRAEWVAQSPVKTMDDVIRAAPIAQKNLGDAGNKIAAKLGVKFKNATPKTHKKDGSINQKGIDRINEKLAKRPGAPVARITDTARGTFILNHPDDAEKVVHELAKTHEVLAEAWRTIPDSHYTDRALLFRDRQTGLIGEVQLAHPAMLDAKDNKGGHELYEKQRALKAGDPEVEKLNAQMRALYGKALDKLDPDWKIIDGRGRR